MAGEWCRTTLGDVLTLQRGFDLPETERKPGPHPVIASTGPVGTHDVAIAQGPGVVIGRSGSLGGGQFIEADFWPLNTTLWVKDFKGNDRRFCYYLLKSLDLAHFNAGSGVPTLNRNHIHPLPVFVPTDPDEQRAIAHILGTLDDKIELNRRMSETLEAMARALFKSWFVDFDPVRARMEGRDPGLPHPLADLFPARLVDSELGEIPEGWEVKNVLQIADLLSGGTPQTSIAEFWDGDIPWVSAKDVSGAGVFIMDTERKITQAGVENSSTKILPRLTTVITARGTVGKCCLLGQEMAMNQTNYGLKAKNCMRPFFLFFTIVEMISELQQQAYGTIFDTITTKTFSGTRILLPSSVMIATYETLVQPMMLQILVNNHQSRTLAALRDALLPKLISGALRVKDAEKFLEKRI